MTIIMILNNNLVIIKTIIGHYSNNLMTDGVLGLFPKRSFCIADQNPADQ